MATKPRRKHGGPITPMTEVNPVGHNHGDASNNPYNQDMNGSTGGQQTQTRLRRHGGFVTTAPQSFHNVDQNTADPPMAASISRDLHVNEGMGALRAGHNAGTTIQVIPLPGGVSQDRFETHQPIVSAKKRNTQKGYRNIFIPRTTFRWKKSRSHQRATLMYENQQVHRHKDPAGRVYNGIEEDRFILANDLHLARMMVQCTDDVYSGIPNSTWRRTFIRNVGPMIMRVADWPFRSVPIKRAAWTNKDWTAVCLRWPFACFAMSYAFIHPSTYHVPPPTCDYYTPLTYKYWGYPKVARNTLENPKREGQSASSQTNPVVERALHPRKLWIRKEKDSQFDLVDVDELMRQEDTSHEGIQFVLVAYTTAQFSTVDDLYTLHATARQAAADAGVQAYWTSADCMATDGPELEQDVYRISDIIRAAHSVAIALKQPSNAIQALTERELLHNWGSRMWTLPEALLGPSSNAIRIYNASDLRLSLYKRDLPRLIWPDTDARITRQLIDHYEGNLTLSRLELVILALEALSTRHTDVHLAGDLAYILMGLLRRRPEVDGTDSEFQAFARLSLANDSDKLLERLLCVQALNPDQPWYITSDAFAAHLWDIEPTCQIASVCENDTVVLDGCLAASVQWEKFQQPYHQTGTSFKRFVARLVLRIATIAFPICLFIAFFNPLIGGILMAFVLPAWILSPWLVKICYSGKFWNVAPHLFGFEGYLDIQTVESNIYGHPSGKLQWSPAGSALSRHCMNEYGECVGDDPTNDPDVARKVEQSKTAAFGQMKVFTIVDTRNATVTLFEATRPPVAALICGQEGGMQRAVMVSLDWKTQTLYRETVLRMPTIMLERLRRVDRVRVGLKRPLEPVVLKGANDDYV